MAQSPDKQAEQDAAAPVSREEAIARLAGLIKDIETCMFTTIAEDGALHSRPMVVQQVEFDGDLWFFTPLESGKTHDLKQDSHVNVAFSSPQKQSYVSVSGRARAIVDKEKARELWHPAMNAWFEGGLEDPNLGLIKVEVDSAQYWDVPSSPVAHILGFLKAKLQGQDNPPIGDNQKVDLS